MKYLFFLIFTLAFYQTAQAQNAPLQPMMYYGTDNSGIVYVASKDNATGRAVVLPLISVLSDIKIKTKIKIRTEWYLYTPNKPK